MEGRHSMKDSHSKRKKGLPLEESHFQDIRREARKQFIRYFRIWFIIAGVLLIILIIAMVRRQAAGIVPRGNTAAPSERVYDYANVLTDEEEEQLRKLIAKREEQIQCDIVMVTIAEDMGTDDRVSEARMRDYADDFYDDNGFGYQQIHGDGVLLLDNSLKGQERITLSTCGAVLDRFGYAEIDRVFDAVYEDVRSNPYQGYRAYVEAVYREMSGKRMGNFPILLIFLIPAVIMVIFVAVNLKSSLGRERVSNITYVAGGKPVTNAMTDDFIRKHVTTRHIPRNDGGGGGRSGGGGGAHVSRGGVSHGGGSRKG